MSEKSNRLLSATVFFSLVSASAFAAAPTPVAVWDGDFSPGELTKFDGYELEDWQLTHGGVSHESGAAGVDYSSVTIDRANAGLMFNATSGMPAITVLAKYSNLEHSTSSKRVIATSSVSSGASRTGVSLTTSGTMSGTWNASGWTDADSSNTMPSSGVVAFTYKGGTGTYLYHGADCAQISSSPLYGSGSLQSSSDSSIVGVSVGGFCANTAISGHEAAQGMTIEALAVFDSVLTVAEMNAYIWPSEVQTIPVTDSIAVSEINNQIDANTYKTVKVVAEPGATITVDEAFSAKIKSVSSTGSITLAAASQPDASYLANVDFSGVQGGLLRSWLTPGVVGFNFRSANGTDVSGALATADNWIHDNNSASGTSTNMFADGLSTLKWSSANTWSCSGSTIISGYLDDGANGGNGAAVTLSNVPYETYDVIVYCSSDSNPGQFLAKTVNGTTYTWDSTAGAVVAGNSTWGKAALSIPVYGVNALRIKNLSGPLTIYGTARNDSNRGGIAAIQIMPPDTPDNIRTYTLTLDGTATAWSSGTWTLNNQTVDAPASGYVEIVASASTALTVDQAVSLADLKVRGGENVVVNVATNSTGSLYTIKATVQGGVFQQGSPDVLGATPAIAVEAGATFDVNGMAVNEANAFAIAGAGAGNWPWALTSSGGDLALGTLRSLSLGANATIGGANRIRFGKSGEASTIAFNDFTLTKTGSCELVLCNGRAAENGTGVFDIAEGEATFSQYTCLDGYESIYASTKVIVRSGATLRNGTNRYIWMDALDWQGGTVSSAQPFAIASSLTGSGTTDRLKFRDGVSATLSGDLTVAAAFTLDGSASFAKSQDASGDVTVTPSGTFTTASGATISVGEGVVFNLGTVRPAASFTIDDEGTLVVQKSGATDVPVVNVSARPANVVFKDENGDGIDSPRLVYDSGAGTLSFYSGNVWTAASGTAFDTLANWSSGVAPASGENATISVSEDTEISVADTYTLDALTISGAGEVTFTGEGSITAGTIALENGATLKRDASSKISATGIAVASGSVLKLDGITESTVISGQGAVETYGDVTFAANNSFYGGLTVKTGTASTTVASGFSGLAGDYDVLVTVEDGACLDLANTANCQHRLVIAGKGVLLQDGTYSGAVKNSGVAMGSNTRQTYWITLAADAMVDVSTGWGIVRNDHYQSTLVLNGHTLTMRGSGTVPMVQVDASSTSGTLVIDGATLQLASTACNFPGVDIVLKGAASVNFETAPTAIGSLTLMPSASGTSAMAWKLPSGLIPSLNTSNIDPAGLSVGDTLTLFTAPTGTELDSTSFSFATGSRYAVTANGNKVAATVKEPLNFFHYDFNAENSIASDSSYNFGNLNPAFVNAKNGKAGKFVSSTTPYYDSNTSGKSPFHAGEMTVMGLVKAKEASNTILWNFGSGWSTGIAVIAKDSSTIALVSWTGGAAGSEVASVTGVDVIGKWHLVTIVADANGTTLYVDGNSASTDIVLPSAIGSVGQFGSIHGTAKNYNAVGTAGFLLDDWRVYDAALTAQEIKALKRELNPDPFILRFR